MYCHWGRTAWRSEGWLAAVKRFIWTVAFGLAGLFLGLKADEPPGFPLWGVLGTAWATTVGYGFGTIFDRKHPTRRPALWWPLTLALVGVFFGLIIGAGVVSDYTLVDQTIASGLGALVGGLLGLVAAKSRRRGQQQADD
jgi:hypothetical protein